MILVNESCATDPTTGTKAGDTAFVTDHLRMQLAASFSRGQFYYTGDLGQDFYSRWDAWAGGGDGAECVWFYWGASATPGEEGDALGSYGVVLNEQADQVQIRFNGTNIHTQAFANLDNSTYRKVEIFVDGQNITVEIDDVEVVNFTDGTVRTLGGTQYGWAGRCGGGNNEHRIKQLFVESPQADAAQTGMGGRGGVRNQSSLQNLQHL